VDRTPVNASHPMSQSESLQTSKPLNELAERKNKTRGRKKETKTKQMRRKT